MTFKETMAKLFSTSEGTYYKWKKEERPIIKLLEKYFDKADLEEFINENKITKIDKFKSLEILLNSNTKSYDEFFSKIYIKGTFEDTVKDISSYKNSIIYKYFKFLTDKNNDIQKLISIKSFNSRLLHYFFSSSNIENEYYLGDELIAYISNIYTSTQYSILYFYLSNFEDYYRYDDLLFDLSRAYEHKIQFDFFIKFENKEIKEKEFESELFYIKNLFKEYNRNIQNIYTNLLDGE